MGILNIPKFVDYRNKVARHKTKKYSNRTNGVNSITDIAIHHSLTLRKLAGSNAEGYARYHVNSLGWPSIGYTYVVEADGTIKYVNDINKLTYHVGNHNNYAVGIVLSGDFRNEKPTKEQEQSLRNLVTALKKKYPRIKNVKGHSDYKGYEWKECPVFDYKRVLASGNASSNTNTSKPNKKPSKPPKTQSKGDMKTTSIVTYLNSIKQPSSFAHRKKLAKQHGIKNYTGTATQNLQLLRILRDGAKVNLTPNKPKKTVRQMAQEVIDGKHGNGHENRRKSLSINRADYEIVRKEVNKIISGNTIGAGKKSISQIANEVIDGKWGNGSDRKRRLTNAGYDYAKIQTEVNRRLK